MKQTLLFGLALFTGVTAFSQAKTGPAAVKIPAVTAAAKSTTALEGTWMYGNFSLTEYWTTSPRTYLGNAFTFAIAFTFKADGTYEQYFTSSVNNLGTSTYHQSVTKGTYAVDEKAKTLTATPMSSHYKRSSFGRTEEDRDMRPNEIAKKDVYNYAEGTEPNGTQSVSLTIAGTKSTLKFLKKGM